MSRNKLFQSPRVYLVTLALLVALLEGCGSRLSCVPVTGAVLIDGQPLASGVLVFTPDASRGNTLRASCTAAVKNGRYELTTVGVTRSETGAGAPPGWYKVTVVGRLPGQQPVPVSPKYTNTDTTPLVVEVGKPATPGAYDVHLSKEG